MTFATGLLLGSIAGAVFGLIITACTHAGADSNSLSKAYWNGYQAGKEAANNRKKD